MRTEASFTRAETTAAAGGRSAFGFFRRARTDARVATARALASLEPAGFQAVHVRRVTGTRTEVDHVAVGPSGLFVVETVSYSGRLEVRGKDLFVGGRRRTDAVEHLLRATDAVRRVLGVDLERTNTPLVPLLCVHRSELPWGTVTVNGVRIVSANEMVHIVRKAPLVMHPAEVERVARILDERLLPI